MVESKAPAAVGGGGGRERRKPTAAIIGSGQERAATLAQVEALGQSLVEAGFRVLTGGLGGVMEAACRGARAAAGYAPGDTIGVLPSYDAADANAYVDVVICTGMRHARNVIVVASASVVIAVGGRAGTLSEIALAWTLGRPVIAVDCPGWSRELAGRCLDERRMEGIIGPLAIEAVAAQARALLGDL